MKLSDYVMERIADTGVRHVFMLPGGGAMHLNDSLGRCKRLEYICNLHEQACAIAADAYGQYTNNLGVCSVTTGPGGTNALTGVAAAWLDSTPMLIVSGQVKRADLATGLGIRQMGFQELDIVSMARPITKYAVLVTEPETIRYHLEKAIWLARNGRPGPTWLDIPLDVQAARVEPEKMSCFDPFVEGLVSKPDRALLHAKVLETLELLAQAERPVILVGNGVRLAKAEKIFLEMARQLDIPLLTTWKVLDFLPEDDPLFIGRPGAVGQRAANFAQQKSDWLLILGARMDLGQTAYMHEHLARDAKKIMVDIDENEIKKMNTKIDVPCPVDAGIFIEEMQRQLNNSRHTPLNWSQWWLQCRTWKEQFPMTLPEYLEFEDGISLYALIDVLSGLVLEGDLVIPGSSGSCSEVTMQAFKSKKGVRVLNSEGLGPMGFGISAAVGGSVASGGKRTICLEGDGGFAMNTQELETVRRLGLPIKFFVLDNKGYGSIRSTQKSYFDERYFASTPEGGLTLPNLENIAQAYGLPFYEIFESRQLKEQTEVILKKEGASITRVVVSTQHITRPRVTSRQRSDGGMETAPMEEMWPEK